MPSLSLPSLLTLLALSGGADREAAEPAAESERLDRLVVRASPLALPADAQVQPAAVIAGEALDRVRAATLGETVAGLPGVHSSWHGPAVGRPILRGLEGGRIGVLAGNLPVIDASTTAADHAVAVEPLLAERIEVLKGPTTLLYGSGAAAGLVQLGDGRIAEAPREGLDASAELRADGVAELRAGAARLRFGSGRLLLSADAFRRETEDYRVPAGALAAHTHGAKDERHEEELRRVPNSATEGHGVGAGLTWFGEGIEFGLAAGRHLSLYGVPGHEHGDHGGPGRAGRRHAKNGDEHEVRIDLASNRYETRLGIDRPLDLIERVDWRLARGDYRHVELEDHDGETEIGTRFRVEGLDSRLDLRHRAFGDWQGVLGIQFGERRLRSAGEEPFVPAYRQRQVGVFLLERMTVGALALELGLRHENQRVHGAGERRRHRPFSLSLGLRHALSEAWHLHGALGRHQRAPFPEELLADGPHAATRAYERGDPTLGLETGHHAELGLHRHGERLELGASLFHTDYRGFIYLADTGEREAGLPVRQWTQAGARFSGLELEGALVLHEGDLGRWRLVAFADGVRARLKRGGWLPRIAPARQRLGLEWEAGTISAALRATRHARQERTAAGEEATPGFTLLDAELGWRLGGDRYRLVLAGRNLGDRVARLHHSYLRDQAPLPGRNLQLSLRASF